MIMTAVTCLALNIYHEDRGGDIMSQMMVAQVTMNRVESSRYPDTVCGVVYDHKQFSWTNNPAGNHPAEAEAWRDSLFLAMDVLEDPSILPGSDASHYHADYVTPYWADDMQFLGRVGKHLFYN